MLTALVATTYTRVQSKQQAEVCEGISRLQFVVFFSMMLLLFLLLFSMADL
jgi:hypothetical protein